MPAPQMILIKTNIKIALLSVIDQTTGLPKYCKKTVLNGVVTPDPTSLMPDMDAMIEAISSGVANTWTAWQASQTVVAGVQVVPATGTGATIPTPGNLP